MKRFTRLIAAVFTTFATSCAFVPLSLDVPPPSIVNNVRVELNGVLRNGLGQIVGLRGVASNVSSEPLQFCTIKFELVDSAGAKIGDAIAMTQHLAPGTAWRFDAYNSGTIQAAIGRVILADVTTDKSMFSKIVSSGPSYDRTALDRLQPKSTTLSQAIEMLGAEPTSTSYREDGSVVASWSHVEVRGSDIRTKSVTLLFDPQSRLVRKINETRTGAGGR